jgi:hypothetical protein
MNKKDLKKWMKDDLCLVYIAFFFFSLITFIYLENKIYIMVSLNIITIINIVSSYLDFEKYLEVISDEQN